jgi:lysophospholipase
MTEPQTTLISTPNNPVPLGGTVGMLDFSRRFGRHIYVRYARWPSVLSERHGTVCVLPGRTEFIEKYFEVIGELRRRGFSVAILDWRGQGGSSRLCRNRLKGHIGSFDAYQADLFSLMNEVVLPDCPPPYYLLAHSMGGAIALKAATRRGSWFDRVVLTAPMLALQDLPCSPALVGSLTGALSACGFGRTLVPGGMASYRRSHRFDGNVLTSDPERFARTQGILQAALELALGPPTIGWVAAAFKAMAEIADEGFARRLRVPVLIIAAGDDRVVSNRAIEALAFRLKLARQIVLRGAMHEILQERDPIRQAFWGAFDAFVPGAKLRNGAAAA